MVSVKHLIDESFQGVAMGMMDGLITLLGIVMGVGVATGDAKLVIITGMVGGIANSFGTSVGFYTSEHAERGQQIEFYKRTKTRAKMKEGDRYIHTMMDIYTETLFSFLSGVTAVVIPIIPFFLNLPLVTSMALCFAIAITMLFSLGFKIGQLNKEHSLKSGLKYLVIGIASALISLLLGELLKHMIMENTIGIF